MERMIRAALVAALLLVFAVPPAAADAGWFESGDTLLRMDLQLLNDAEVIRLPTNQWPVPRAAVAYALEHGKPHFATNVAVLAALARVRARVDSAAERTSGKIGVATFVTGGDPSLLRDFDTLGRENGELGGRVTYDSGIFSGALAATAVTDPEDGESLRLDGSHATVKLGNWLLSANELDRWWGPSHESSLILSSNARPMPTLTFERAEARPFNTRWLDWLGPWRFNFSLSQMETHREDIDAPLFMAARLEFMPFKDIELGFSRTSQFCGKELQCDLGVLWNMLIGNDNVGIDATPENEPGNQMAGFDIRWSSPIGNWPYAIYSQMIGEDESSYVPAKYLNQYGAEVWKPRGDGALILGFAEYSSTTCSANTGRGPYYNCAYTQGLFNIEGYRYRGRVIGHTTDNDAETYSIGAKYSTPGGEIWTATARMSSLNHDGVDPRNTVAASPTDYLALELGWKGKLYGERISVDFGIESIEPKHESGDVSPFGFVSWHHEFKP